jgi:hypothetical protein
MIVYRYDKPTKNYRGSTDIFVDGRSVGYYVCNQNRVKGGENVFLVLDTGWSEAFTSVKELKDYVRKMFERKS